MRRFIPRSGAALAAAAALLLPPPPSGALGAQEPATVKFERYRLDNGLTVILAPDRSTQVVAVDVTYDVGSRNERPGRTGFAHLFEHMMFQGSDHVKKAEHFAYVTNAGGGTNGFTTEDRTEYFEVLPSNRLNLGLWLEADRMRSLAVTDENFRNQREAIKEEIRLKVENVPFTGTILAGVHGLADSAGCFGYAHHAFGSTADLDSATTPEVQAFFDRYYAPNNATLVIAGDFDPAEAKRLVAQYFGGVKRGPEAPPPVRCEQRFNTGALRRTINDPHAPLPAVYHIYRIPEPTHADYPALMLLGDVMAGGANARLRQRLVREEKVATAAAYTVNSVVSGATNRPSPRRGAGALVFVGIASQGVSADTLDARLAAELRRVVADGVTEDEMTAARERYRAQVINNRQMPLYVAEDLQVASMFLGGPEAVNTDLQRYLRVTAADVKRVAQTYLRLDNSMVAIALPGGKP